MQTFASTTKTDRSAGNKPARSAAELDAVLNHSVSTISPLTIHRNAGCSCGGGCPSCQSGAGNLKVSQPNDAAEIEADAIADRVMRMPVHEAKPFVSTLNSSNTIQRKCDACETEEQEEIPEPVMRKEALASAASTHPPVNTPSSMRNVLNSGGHSLDIQTRSFFEPRFGHDLGHVRIHTDTMAGQAARSVNAIAFTSGRNVVFAPGQYQPETETGKSLLAHELTHVLQQGAGAAIRNGNPLKISWVSDPVLQRQPSGGRRSSRPRPPHITQIVVNQTTPQTVTATFSDGRTDSGEVSTGKGHCCFDDSAGTAEGGACSATRSTQVGNNCTPVGNFTVTAKVPVTGGGVRLWTQFHDAKSVALHEYSPVDGTSLSHGCVRMHAAMAQTIFDGSRVGVTRVRVEDLARPRCEHPALQNEWSGDFTSAGSTPPDGTTIDPFLGRRLTRAEIARERRHIRESREEMRSALGTNDAGLDAEIAAVAGGASIVSRIPRCVPALTVEEQQVSAAQSSGFLASGAATTSAAFATALGRTRNEAGAERLVRQTGEQLWQDATALARGGGAGTDDRQIYWTRLMLTNTLRQWNPSWVPNADALRRLHTRLLSLLEQTSRGFTASTFSTGNPDQKRFLISGFDPFGFPNAGDIRQSNLSGAAALALDGVTLTHGAVSAQVESVVFPVRYADFNEGIVENHLRPHLTGSNPPHLVMSISQGSKQFEFEESAGRRRSTDSFLENLGRPSGGSPSAPIEPTGIGSGAEFLSHSVPASTLGAMRGAVGRTGPIKEEVDVIDLPSGATAPRTLSGGPGSSPGQAVEGSGGGFLSNEIFYRNSLLRTQLGSDVPMIHLHTPRLAPDATDAARNVLITKIREILVASLPTL